MRILKDGLLRHLQSIKSGFTASVITCNQLITLYSKNGLLREAQRLFDEMPQRTVFSWNAIISAYVRSQDLTHARFLFDATSDRDLVTYNTLLAGYVNAEGYENYALDLFLEMQGKWEKNIGMDEFTATTMLNLSAKLCMVCYGRQLHAFMAKTGNDLSGFGLSALIDMYSKCGFFKEAHDVFRRCDGEIDLVSKNAMLAACCRNGSMEMAMELFWQKAELNDTVSWNTMILGYAQNGCSDAALKLFIDMAKNGVRWTEHTFVSVLNGLRNIKRGKEIHAWVLKNGIFSNPFITSAIVDVYCKCGNLKYAESAHMKNRAENSYSISSLIVGHSLQGNMLEARKLFDSLEEKNTVVWTALFSGYKKTQQSEAVFELLNEFIKTEASVLDDLILVNVLGACAIQSALNSGKQVHAYMFRKGVDLDEKLASAMVDMYSKSGNISYAASIFKSAMNKDSILYNVMIAGYAHHGYELQAIHLFEKMVEKGLKPDLVTFVAILSACRHGGLVELGEKYFKSMIDDYNIVPEIDHYTCMIDLYGKANQLNKAVEFTRNIPIEGDAAILGAFLHACKINRNSEFAAWAEEKLLSVDGNNGSRYVLLASVYASEGNWADTGRIWKKMNGKDVKKFAGCSWVYVENKLHSFTSGDTFHSQIGNVYPMIDFLTGELNEGGDEGNIADDVGTIDEGGNEGNIYDDANYDGDNSEVDEDELADVLYASDNDDEEFDELKTQAAGYVDGFVNIVPRFDVNKLFGDENQGIESDDHDYNVSSDFLDDSDLNWSITDEEKLNDNEEEVDQQVPVVNQNVNEPAVKEDPGDYQHVRNISFPMVGRDDWPETIEVTLAAPPVRLKSGRPQQKRYPEKGEKGNGSNATRYDQHIQQDDATTSERPSNSIRVKKCAPKLLKNPTKKRTSTPKRLNEKITKSFSDRNSGATSSGNSANLKVSII
ncbi:hypothetical protein ACFE04_005404 [Oxalis oulophora]